MNRKPAPDETLTTLIEPERYELFESPRYHFELDRRGTFSRSSERASSSVSR